MPVRCKFTCDLVSKVHQGNGKVLHNVKFSPVYSTNPESENTKFWEHTPNGTLEFGSIKDHNFEVGKEYYLDIYRA